MIVVPRTERRPASPVASTIHVLISMATAARGAARPA
jgi:hypothetical protein